MTSSIARLWLASAAALALAACGAREHTAASTNPPQPGEAETVFLSEPFKVDRIFRSMMGPVVQRSVSLVDTAEPELLWLTGYAVDVVEADSTEPASIEYECHSNLAWGSENPGFERPAVRAFTLTQGQEDLRLPEGFGLPMLSTEKLGLNSQVLNLNRPEVDVTVRHRLRVRYVRDAAVKQPMKALAMSSAFVMATLEGTNAVFNVEEPSEEVAGATCMSGVYPKGAQSGIYKDKFQRRFTGHWVVPPGRHEYRTLVTEMIQIPYDTTIHFIGVHVHPFSESLALNDLTTGETVWKSFHKTSSTRIGLDLVDAYSSAEGLPFHKGHQYELVSVYDNPTDKDSDAMATMFLYYLDKEYKNPLMSTAAAAPPAPAMPDPMSAPKGG